MKELINEYIETKKYTRKLYKRTFETYENCEDELLKEKLYDDLANIRQMIGSLQYSIEVMTTGRFRSRGIERRAAYEREIPVSDEMLIANSDRASALKVESEVNEDEEEVKQLLAKEISRVLSLKEREVFNLAANEFSQRQIAEMLNMPRTTVQSILSTCKSKIIAEGWVIV